MGLAEKLIYLPSLDQAGKSDTQGVELSGIIADVDGVTLIAVKTLIERNAALESRVNALEAIIRKMAGQQDPMIQKALLTR